MISMCKMFKAWYRRVCLKDYDQDDMFLRDNQIRIVYVLLAWNAEPIKRELKVVKRTFVCLGPSNAFGKNHLERTCISGEEKPSRRTEKTSKPGTRKSILD